MHDGRRHFQHATKLYELPKTAPIFMCFNNFLYTFVMGNKISQTAQTLGCHIYSTNIDIPRLWHDIYISLTKYIAHESLKMQGLFTF